MHVDGACHCGDVTYTAEIDPAKVIICHCTDCQVLSSSAFRMVVLAEKGSFRLLGGKPTIYVKTADSGRKRFNAFLPTGGTQMYRSPPGRDSGQHSGYRGRCIVERAQF